MKSNKNKNRNKNKMTIEGGYASSLTGISQQERAEAYVLARRGGGIHESKKRKESLKPKHKNRKQSDSYAFLF